MEYKLYLIPIKTSLNFHGNQVKFCKAVKFVATLFQIWCFEFYNPF